MLSRSSDIDSRRQEYGAQRLAKLLERIHFFLSVTSIGEPINPVTSPRSSS